MTSRTQTKKERQTTKKRAEREARIRAAKRRQRQRIGLVVGLLAGAGVVAVTLSLMGGDTNGDTNGFAGENCGDAAPEATVEPGGAYSEAPAMQINCDLQYVATIKTNHGDIAIQLMPQVAPVTVNNLVALARDGFYDGLTFHRVIDGFMIQGGDPNGDGSGGPGYKFQDEFREDRNFDGKYRLAMANSGADTNGSQFFITVGPTPHLNQKHTIFGQVIEGQDVVDAIAVVEKGENDAPVTPVTIETIEITETGGEDEASVDAGEGTVEGVEGVEGGG